MPRDLLLRPVLTKKWPGVGPGVVTCQMILVTKKVQVVTELKGRGTSSTLETPPRSPTGPALSNEHTTLTCCRHRPCCLRHFVLSSLPVIAGRLQEPRRYVPICASKIKARGCYYAPRHSSLVIYKINDGIVWAFQNLPGFELCCVNILNFFQLAQDGHI